jgi:hypothetical protein
MQPYGRPYGLGSIIGVHLDMWKGTLQFYLNRKPLGKYSKCYNLGSHGSIKITGVVFSGVTSPSSVDWYQHFGGTYRCRDGKAKTTFIMVSCDYEGTQLLGCDAV